MAADSPTILATSGGTRRGTRSELLFGPLVLHAVELAGVTGRAPPAMPRRHRRRRPAVLPGLAGRGGAGGWYPCPTPEPVPDAERRGYGRAAAGPRCHLGQRRQRGEPAGAVAAAWPGSQPAPGLGGGGGAGRSVCGFGVLARRGDHRFLRPPAASGHQRAGVPAVLQRRPLRLRAAAPACCISGWSPKGRCPADTPPTTGSACSTGAPR